MSGKPWIGVSEAHRRLLGLIERVAPMDVELLICGETGVGKEHYARYAHACSPRAAGPFVPVNCGSIPADLFENELFGHVGGAFTGARRGPRASARRAHGPASVDGWHALPAGNAVTWSAVVRDLQNMPAGSSVRCRV